MNKLAIDLVRQVSNGSYEPQNKKQKLTDDDDDQNTSALHLSVDIIEEMDVDTTENSDDSVERCVSSLFGLSTRLFKTLQYIPKKLCYGT